MGTPPPSEIWEEGAACATCVDVIFDGSTPKYVEAHVKDVIICPGVPPPGPDGVLVLPQLAACTWGVAKGAWTYRYQLFAGTSLFSIMAGPGIAFFHQPIAICQTSFTNQQLVCAPPFGIAKLGTCEIYWGPTIGA